MAKTATVRARVEPALKQEAEDVLEQLGMSPTTAISMFYEQITLRHALPFDVALPNLTTQAAMADAEAGRVTRAMDAKSLIAQLDVDD
ncbi:MAG: type II toxin-antitoxin system RelB/DinJ family antitoxin [Gemmatimonadaceae bacterium]|nr:type II toxin-antitoxin system RelB/DinJ family antitoxin [Gemmatimonadaceae bacterium]